MAGKIQHAKDVAGTVLGIEIKTVGLNTDSYGALLVEFEHPCPFLVLRQTICMRVQAALLFWPCDVKERIRPEVRPLVCRSSCERAHIPQAKVLSPPSAHYFLHQDPINSNQETGLDTSTATIAGQFPAEIDLL